MSAYPQFRAATPRVTRLEMADLYVGDGTTVVQLDAVPCETWTQTLRMLVSQSATLSGVEVEVEGAWVQFIGIRKSAGPGASDLLDVIAAAGELAYTTPITRSAASVPAPALSAQ